jgi:hypothetical protein
MVVACLNALRKECLPCRKHVEEFAWMFACMHVLVAFFGLGFKIRLCSGAIGPDTIQSNGYTLRCNVRILEHLHAAAGQTRRSVPHEALVRAVNFPATCAESVATTSMPSTQGVKARR